MNLFDMSSDFSCKIEKDDIPFDINNLDFLDSILSDNVAVDNFREEQKSHCNNITAEMQIDDAVELQMPWYDADAQNQGNSDFGSLVGFESAIEVIQSNIKVENDSFVQLSPFSVENKPYTIEHKPYTVEHKPYVDTDIISAQQPPAYKIEFPKKELETYDLLPNGMKSTIHHHNDGYFNGVPNDGQFTQQGNAVHQPMTTNAVVNGVHPCNGQHSPQYVFQTFHNNMPLVLVNPHEAAYYEVSNTQELTHSGYGMTNDIQIHSPMMQRTAEGTAVNPRSISMAPVNPSNGVQIRSKYIFRLFYPFFGSSLINECSVSQQADN